MYTNAYPVGRIPFGGASLQIQRCVYLTGFLSEFIADPLISPYAYPAYIPPLITYIEDILQPGLVAGTIPPEQAQQSIALYIGTYANVLDFYITSDFVDCLILYSNQIGAPPGLWNGVTNAIDPQGPVTVY